MPLTSYIHPRLGLPSFLKFQPYFLEALRAWPKETQFNILGGLSPSTITARMRDALQGYRLNKDAWRESVNPEFVTLFAQYDGQFMISMAEDATVWFRQRHKQGKHIGASTARFHEVEGELDKHIRSKSFVAKATHQGPAGPEHITINPAHLTEQDFNNLMVLLAHEAFDLPLLFSGDLTSKFSDSFQLHGVTAVYNQQRNETVVI